MNDDEFRALLMSAVETHVIDSDLKRRILRSNSRRIRRRRTAAVGSAAALLAVWLATGLTRTESSERAQDSSVSGSDRSAPASANGPLQVRFDDLGGGAATVKVYRGTGPTQTDREQAGTYRNGDEVGVVCVVKGRTVSSEPGVGERDAQSSLWARLNTDPPVYATLTYAVLTDFNGQVIDPADAPAC